MKILVMSDTHGAYNAIRDVLEKEGYVDIALHLGDSELPKYLLSDFVCVKGNCDFSDEYEKVKEINVEGYKIHLEHGDSYYFNINPNKYIETLNVDIFLFGHTHKRLASKLNNTYIFNPGSLTRPRDSDKGSYLILELEKNKPLKYEFKEFDL